MPIGDFHHHRTLYIMYASRFKSPKNNYKLMKVDFYNSCVVGVFQNLGRCTRCKNSPKLLRLRKIWLSHPGAPEFERCVFLSFHWSGAVFLLGFVQDLDVRCNSPSSPGKIARCWFPPRSCFLHNFILITFLSQNPPIGPKILGLVLQGKYPASSNSAQNAPQLLLPPQKSRYWILRTAAGGVGVHTSLFLSTQKVVLLINFFFCFLAV